MLPFLAHYMQNNFMLECFGRNNEYLELDMAK